MPEKPIYHIVSHTHWDREWYRPFERFRAMLVRMIDDLLDLLDTNPGYRAFLLDGQTSVLEDYLTVRPERARDLKRFGSAGRLFAGPWYVLPDEFLVSGEALVRNLLLGRALAARHHTGMDAGYIPDSFGHIAAMPAILRGFGIDNTILYRGFGGEPEHTSSEYDWYAPDGQQVLMIHLHRHGYSGAWFHGDTGAEALRRFHAMCREVDGRAQTRHRLLLNGGDHFWPDPDLPATLAKLAERSGACVKHSTLPDYIEALRAERPAVLPRVDGELRSGYRYAFVMHGGVYSSRVGLKQQNWACQLLLERVVEPLHLLAVRRGMKERRPLLTHAWRELLKNHPHDSICGCSIDEVHRDMETRFAAVRAIAADLIETSFEHLTPAHTREYSGDDRTLIVYNPSPLPRGGVVEASLRFHLQDVVVGLNPDVQLAHARPAPRAITIHGADGTALPLQVLEETDEHRLLAEQYNYPKQSFVRNIRALIRVEDIPAYGYATFDVTREAEPIRAARHTSLRCGTRHIENDMVRIRVLRNGTVEITDLVRGKVYRGMHRFEDGGDVGDEYTYAYPPDDHIVTTRRAVARVDVMERGPLRATLRIRCTLRVPEAAAADRHTRSRRNTVLDIETYVSLEEGSALVCFTTTLVNTAKDHRLRLVFPTRIPTRTALVDTPFAVIERRAEDFDPADFTIEHPPRVAPMSRYVCLRETSRGLALFTAGLPEYELAHDGSGDLRLTLLRCVGQLGAEGLTTRPGGKGGWHNETPDAQCPGGHSFRYALLPTCGASPDLHTLLNEYADRFHLAMTTRSSTVPRSSFARQADSLLALDTWSAVPSALKLAEDGRGTVLRLWNPSGEALRVGLAPAVPMGVPRMARLDETAAGPVLRNPDAVDIPPHGIVTVRFTHTHP